MCLSESSGSQLNIQQLVEHFDQKGSLLIIGDIDTSQYFRKLFNEFGVSLMDYSSSLIDNIHNYQDD